MNIQVHEYKQEVNQLLEYGFHETRFGECLIALQADYVCYLAFITTSHEDALKELLHAWQLANVIENSTRTKIFVDTIFTSRTQTIKVLLKGTPFQIKVWRELAKIPISQRVSYQYIAQLIDQPQAVRAAARAVAQNSIAYLIPCHRVILKSGKIHNYRWGAARKKKMLEHEQILSESITQSV